MNTTTGRTFTASIYIAGDRQAIESILREWVMRGDCVSVEFCRYIFKGGSEDGVKLGFINYPRFPSAPERIKSDAIELAALLVEKTFQLSCSVVTPDETIWVHRAEKTESKIQ